MEKVKITIVSSGVSEGQALPTDRQVYRGQLAERAGKYYVIYDEDAQSGLEGTKTTIKWNQEQLVILRNGSVIHRQEFQTGLLINSTYITPYLKLNLGTQTHYLSTYFLKGVWHLDTDYTLYHEGRIYGDMKIRIEIEVEG